MKRIWAERHEVTIQEHGRHFYVTSFAWWNRATGTFRLDLELDREAGNLYTSPLPDERQFLVFWKREQALRHVIRETDAFVAKCRERALQLLLQSEYVADGVEKV